MPAPYWRTDNGCLLGVSPAVFLYFAKNLRHFGKNMDAFCRFQVNRFFARHCRVKELDTPVEHNSSVNESHKEHELERSMKPLFCIKETVA